MVVFISTQLVLCFVFGWGHVLSRVFNEVFVKLYHHCKAIIFVTFRPRK